MQMLSSTRYDADMNSSFCRTNATKRLIIGSLTLFLMQPAGLTARAEMVTQSQPSEISKDAPLTAAECQVWTALGRSLFGWGAKPADARHFVIFYRPSGGGYVEQCPWAQLGVKPPRMQKPNLDDVEFFGTPVFENRGQTTVVDKTIRLNGKKAGPHGVFMQTDRCTLHKVNKVWVLNGCQTLAIT